MTWIETNDGETRIMGEHICSINIEPNSHDGKCQLVAYLTNGATHTIAHGTFTHCMEGLMEVLEAV